MITTTHPVLKDEVRRINKELRAREREFQARVADLRAMSAAFEAHVRSWNASVAAFEARLASRPDLLEAWHGEPAKTSLLDEVLRETDRSRTEFLR